MSKLEIGAKTVRQSGRFSIVREVSRATYRAGKALTWYVETEGQPDVMTFDTLREAREWFDDLVAEEAAKAQPLRERLCTPVSVAEAGRSAATSH